MPISDFRLSLVGGVVTALLCIVMVQPAAAEPEGKPCDPNGQEVAYGDVLEGCTIDPVADLDVFQFAGSVGDDVTILVSLISGFPAFPCVELRDPDDNTISGPTCDLYVRLSHSSLPKSGTYRLIVTDSGNDGTFVFNLSIERLFPLRSSTPLGFDDVVVDREHKPVSDLDTFSFTGQAGDQVRIILGRTSGIGLPCLEVRGPANSHLVELTCGGSSVDLPLSLTISGTHQVIVTESASFHVLPSGFGYNLSLNCLSGSCPHPRPPSCFVDPSVVGNTLTLDFTLGTAEPAQWHIAVAALGTTFRLWTLPLPVIDPPIAAPFSIPGFPSLGEVGFLSTLTTAAGITCRDFKTVDTGVPGVEMTVHGLENLLRRNRQDK